MMPKWHVLFGGIFSLVLIAFFDLSLVQGAIVFISSVMIDLDHYVLYVIKERKIHPKKFWDHSMKRRDTWRSFSKKEKKLHKEPHFILHGLETIFILIILSYFLDIFFWIFLGLSFHIFLDILERIYSSEHLSTKSSQIWLWQRNKKRNKVLR